MTRRWHATTFNEQFETFGNTVNEYSFELTHDEIHTCGALVLHNGVRGPTTGKTWGHLFLFPNSTIREHELAQSVHRRYRSHVRRFVLRNPLKSKTLPSGVQQLYVLKPIETKTISKSKRKQREALREERAARTKSKHALYVKSAQQLLSE